MESQLLMLISLLYVCHKLLHTVFRKGIVKIQLRVQLQQLADHKRTFIIATRDRKAFYSFKASA